MPRTYRAQKAALTRAINSGDPGKVIAECVRTVREWNESDSGYWPDDWHRWERAMAGAAYAIARERGSWDPTIPQGCQEVA